MSFGLILKKSASWSCVVYSFIVAFYSFLVLVLFDGIGMNPISVFLLYPFSFTVSLASCISRYSAMKAVAKAVTHFVLFTLALVLFVFLPYGGVFSSQNALILFVAYCVFYLVVAAVSSSIKTARRRKNEKKSEYKNVY